MSASADLSRVTIDLPKKDHKRLKALAAVLGKSMRELVVDWIHSQLYSSNMPNDETLKAIKNIENRQDLIEAENAEDLFRKLGI